jgi:hypothetical protein
MPSLTEIWNEVIAANIDCFGSLLAVLPIDPDAAALPMT